MSDFSFPLCTEIPYQDPCLVFSQFSGEEGALFLDSAEERVSCGRYSFIALYPFQMLMSKKGWIELNNRRFQANPLEVLRKELKRFSQETVPERPPFQGGAAGYFGYELVKQMEKLAWTQEDELQFPDLVLGFYDLVLGFDLLQKQAWIFSSGYPYQEKEARLLHAEQRQAFLLARLPALPTELAPLVEQNKRVEIHSNFSSRAYQEQVQKVIDYILAGDIFEANLSQGFRAYLPQALTPFELYRRLRAINPAPFAAYFHFADSQIASASPERFIKLTRGSVETRPIKGTRRRGASLEEDEQLAQELLNSEKDRAENVMIVDLLRNDLSRVCEAHSVQVKQLCGLESYPTVHHLVSVITGQLSKGREASDLLAAAFPGGSITGAPKYRAMEIIAELEPTERGPYCGSLAYLGFDGNMDSSITIRTFCIKNNKVYFQTGGAVVLDSQPAQEYEEVLIKAGALFRALGTDYDFINR